MSTITLPKIEYQKIIQNQSNLAREVCQLKSTVEIFMADEVTDRVKIKLEKQSKAMDQGKGKIFNSMREFDNFMKDL
mgnify:FL=1